MTDTIENSQQKSELVSQIGSKLFRLDLSMGQAAKRFGITQTGVNQLLSSELDDFSIEQLQTFLQELEG